MACFLKSTMRFAEGIYMIEPLSQCHLCLTVAPDVSTVYFVTCIQSHEMS
jgi:hypothetical protein